MCRGSLVAPTGADYDGRGRPETAMTRFFAIAALGIATLTGAASIADAQPGRHYAEPPPPPPPLRPAPDPQVRRGLTLGFDVGAGSMEADSGAVTCDGCDDRAAGSFGFWVGGMINPRLALLFHGSIAGIAVDEFGDQSLINSTALVAARWWLSRRWWIKGGLGYASLTISSPSGDQGVAKGAAGMLGVGFEAVHAPNFSVDVALTATESSYTEIDERIGTGILSLGINWY